MSSPWKKQPEDVVDSVLKRAEVGKVSIHPLEHITHYCDSAGGLRLNSRICQ